jgi:methylated-DNA-[protein]-cysteine S-methyltransferase
MPMINHFFLDSPLGTLTLVNTDGLLSGLYMECDSAASRTTMLGCRSVAGAGFEAAAEELREYFDRQRTQFSLQVMRSGTPFQRRVWDLLLTIPYGETRTYAQVAEAIGNRAAVRAVGLANGRNPISIVVPCHRVIGSDGSLTGYGGGLDRKRFLLELENPVGWGRSDAAGLPFS